jgi:hypothetical protein
LLLISPFAKPNRPDSILKFIRELALLARDLRLRRADLSTAGAQLPVEGLKLINSNDLRPAHRIVQRTPPTEDAHPDRKVLMVDCLLF